MKILVTYDVDTTSSTGKTRLRRVAKECVDYGQRVQNSVFECTLSEVNYICLKDRLSHIIDKTKDSVRFYHLASNRNNVIESIGMDTSYDVEGPLIL